ncbi:myo-inositol transporter [Tolypocladium capitatum]|uniref:ubiquitinyl hydrolase 1 n=1 Tax=Tolypocladium capitatum TaxID=45235 RepID=A0A2K3QLR8_9HYPO|nr:myo-inositol transporter [Tolypocladium capitatum]
MPAEGVAILPSGKKSFIPLENNPEVFTSLVRDLGVSEELGFYDVYSVDDADLVALVPRPALALIFITPPGMYNAVRAEDGVVHHAARAGDDIVEHTSDVTYDKSGADEPVMWFQQTIGNACGLMALLHSVANGEAREFVRSGSVLDGLINKAAPLKPVQRASALYESEALEQAHMRAARLGNTAAPSAEKHAGHHFLAFVKGKDNHLWELEGSVDGPLDRGELGAGEDVMSGPALERGVNSPKRMSPASATDSRPHAGRAATQLSDAAAANMDGSQAPLMAHGHGEDQVEHEVEDDGRQDSAGDGGKAHETPGAFALALTFAAGINDTGVISATLVSIGTSLSDRDLTSMDKSIITSSTSLFALLASPLSSVLADRLGRKRVILYADVLFIVGALLQAVCSTVPAMVAGRCIVGAGVGAASFVVPLYIAEVAPASHRGRLVTTNVLFITIGQMVAYVIGWVFSAFGSKETGWRWMVGMGALPAALQGGVLVFMPETPRWLVKVGRSAAAKLVIQRVNGGDAVSTRVAEAVVRQIETEACEEQEARRLREHQRSGTWKWLGAWRELTSEGKNRRALAIACLLQGLQQLCGFVKLADVFLRHHLRPRRVQEPDADITDGGSHQLFVYARGAGPHRPDRQEAHPAVLDAVHGARALVGGFWLLLSLAQPDGRRARQLGARGRRRRCSGQHHGFRGRLCARPGQRPVDAERALPAGGAVPGQRRRDGDELDGQLRRRADVFADDGRAESVGDVYTTISRKVLSFNSGKSGGAKLGGSSLSNPSGGDDAILQLRDRRAVVARA